jgi:hypothetical protein
MPGAGEWRHSTRPPEDRKLPGVITGRLTGAVILVLCGIKLLRRPRQMSLAVRRQQGKAIGEGAMTERGEAEWTEDDFIPREGQDPLEQLRDGILRQLVQGVPRERIEEELVRQGYALEYAIALVDSVKRTGRHDGVIYGTRTYNGGGLVFFDEDPNSKGRRRRAERGQRKIRAVTEASVAPNPELIFDETPVVSESRAGSRRAVAPPWVFILGAIILLLGGIVLLAATVLYWLANQP